jgi:hypothetical protein
MPAISPCEYELITIESDQGVTIDLRLGVVSFQYFEDLFSPTITAKMVIISTSGVVSDDKTNKIESLYNGLPIRGGERVSVRIKGNSKVNNGLQFDTPETYLYVSKISNVIRDGQKEIFVLHLVSREAITNEVTHVNRKFEPYSKIDDHVKNILQKDLKVKVNRWKGNIDSTSNKYGFLGNLKSPFQILVWLASKATPQTQSSGGFTGYFFYQTQSGFNFRSVDSLIRDGLDGRTARTNFKATREYTHKQFTDYINETGDFNILAYSIKRNNDLLRKLIVGQYSNFTASFNPLNGRFSKVEEGSFNLKDILNQPKGKKISTLGDVPEVPTLLSDDGMGLGQLPSRILSVVKDVGTLSKTASKEDTPGVSQTQREALVRYNLLFQQVVSIIIPLNTNLQVGELVKLNFLGSPEGSTYDRKQSGYYLIKELCHAFDTEQSITSMTVIRDTFGEFGKE